MEELKCPHCGGTDISASFCFDTEVLFDYNITNEVVLRKIKGYCDDCGATNLLWTEVYEFKGYKDVIANE